MPPLDANKHLLPAGTITMDRRTNETPMDFEWQTRAPGNTTSPFYQLALQHQNRTKDKKRELIDVDILSHLRILPLC